ncbi:MAG: zinc ribbon domain-containing protein [Deltaproteobacteria bacterium]|nr:zinc ribbon domain-containing protein [Deltaproteobacteria bacterium]
MPIYEYECAQCGKIEEALQKISDKPLKKCRHCNGKLHKLVSQSSFQLKGTGWYVTDYADRSKKAPSSTDKKVSEPSSSSEKKASSSGTDTAGKAAPKAVD